MACVSCAFELEIMSKIIIVRGYEAKDASKDELVNSQMWVYCGGHQLIKTKLNVITATYIICIVTNGQYLKQS